MKPWGLIYEKWRIFMGWILSLQKVHLGLIWSFLKMEHNSCSLLWAKLIILDIKDTYMGE